MLVVGLTYVYAPTGPSEETYQTAFGTQMSVDLPDGSEAILNAKSSITFNNDTWDENRTVSLTGEAYFKVKKGEKNLQVTFKLSYIYLRNKSLLSRIT